MGSGGREGYQGSGADRIVPIRTGRIKQKLGRCRAVVNNDEGADLKSKAKSLFRAAVDDGSSATCEKKGGRD
jgi:hypothetical protein